MIKQKQEVPMGISQWKAYGKKYGYWKYFLEKWLPDMFKII